MFNAHRHSAEERTQPGLAHSRRVHLLRLKHALGAVFDTHIKRSPNTTLIDLGCGNKPYHYLLADKVGRYTGIDLPGNPGADAFVDPETNRCDVPDAAGDIVLSVQVLEHVESPQAYLEEARRLLKDDGILILSTHGHWMYHPDPVDNWRWTCTGLRLELQRAGFQVIQLTGVQGFLSTSLQLVQDACLNSFPLVKYWRTPFCFVMQRLIAAAEWFTDRSATLSAHRNVEAAIFVLIARKSDAH
jgi:SAM-dependent methyltransferase